MSEMSIKPKWIIKPRHAKPEVRNAQACVCYEPALVQDAWEARVQLSVLNFDKNAAGKDQLGNAFKLCIYQKVYQMNYLIDDFGKSCAAITVLLEDIFELDDGGSAKLPDDHCSYWKVWGPKCPTYCELESHVLVDARLVKLVWPNGDAAALTTPTQSGIVGGTKANGTASEPIPADGHMKGGFGSLEAATGVKFQPVGDVRTIWHFDPIVLHCGKHLPANGGAVPAAPDGGCPAYPGGPDAGGPTTPGGGGPGGPRTPHGGYGSYRGWDRNGNNLGPSDIGTK